MIELNSFGKKMIYMKCFCGGFHCSGDICIQPDVIKNKPCFYVGVTDSSGNDQATMWLDKTGVEELIAGLQELLKENNDDTAK